MEWKTKHKMTNQYAHKHRHLGNDWQVIANAILGFWGIALILMQSKLNAKSQPPSPRRASYWVKQLSWAVTR